MRDSRVSVMPSTVISADGAVNGPSIPLLADYVGSHKHGTSLYGLPIEIIAKSVVTGTGDGFTVTVDVQVAPDNSGSPGTWVAHNRVGVFTMDTDGNFLDNAGAIARIQTRQKLQTRVRTDKAWARLVFTAAGITGGESVTVFAELSDGTRQFADTGILS